MVDKVFYPQPIVPVGKPQGSEKPKQVETPKIPFRDILQEQVGITQLKFSQHARQRLQVRNIELTPADMAKIDAAVDKAAAKGARDSLILMKDLAFVVSVKNKTVITAVDGSSMKDHVFTNIDSAVIV
ncbi:MAG: TIGR02530 family flagellar biosynthesis protein [Bacillota bacterium]